MRSSQSKDRTLLCMKYDTWSFVCATNKCFSMSKASSCKLVTVVPESIIRPPPPSLPIWNNDFGIGKRVCQLWYLQEISNKKTVELGFLSMGCFWLPHLRHSNLLENQTKGYYFCCHQLKWNSTRISLNQVVKLRTKFHAQVPLFPQHCSFLWLGCSPHTQNLSLAQKPVLQKWEFPW